MTRPWRSEGDESPIDRVVLSPLAIPALALRMGAATHRWVYERGVRSARRLPCCVVAVGSIVAGGTGKTPVAAWVAARLRERGLRVALASRGYRGAHRGPVTVVSDGHRVQPECRLAGDEAMLLLAQAPGVPVLVGRDRGVVGLHAISVFGTEVLVLDDGFQHHRLHRDVLVATFDGGMGFGNGRVLPRGPLREGGRALSRAQAVGVVDGPLRSEVARRIEVWAPDAVRFRARRRAVALRSLAGDAAMHARGLEGMRVGMLAGIANPEAFRRSLAAIGIEVVAERLFRDHHHYRPADLRGLRDRAPVWVTTEKDAVKILPTWLGSLDLRVLVSELEVEAPDVFVDWLVGRVQTHSAVLGHV